MFIPTIQDAAASTDSVAFEASAQATVLPTDAPPVPREQVRHMLFGTPAVVQTTIRRLHMLGYAEVNDWSRLLSTGRTDEVMAILTKRVEVG
ncbi:MAG: hypothetical protein AAFR12_01625 [Cyanobacteria bacterium J06626_6]